MVRMFVTNKMTTTLSALWCDKYRPKSFSKLIYHKDIGERLANLVKRNDFPHIMFQGVSGSGKRTLINCILNALYGSHAEKLKLEQLEFTVPSSKKKVEISAIGSAFHLTITPRFIVQEVIKQIAQTNPQVVDVALKSNSKKFKVIVLDDCDSLTQDAQDGLRRTMEICSRQCRLILCCSLSASRIIPALKSRVFCVRVPAPSTAQMNETIDFVLKKEALSATLPDRLRERIIAASEGNMRKALLMLEACKANNYPWSANQDLVECDWLLYIRQTASLLVQEQSANKLLEVRERFYKLLECLIPANIIFKELCLALAKLCDDTHVRSNVVRLAAQCEHLCAQGQKPIIHLESFAAQFMYSYKNFIDQTMMIC